MKLTQFGYMNSRQPTAEELKRVTPAELGFDTGVFHSGKVYSGGFSIYRSSVEREQFKEGYLKGWRGMGVIEWPVDYQI